MVKTYVNDNFSGDDFTVIHGDDHKTEAKMKRVFTSALQSNHDDTIILDATHPSVIKRQIFISIAKQYTSDIRLIHICKSLKVAMEGNMKRGSDKMVPNIALYMYRKKFEEPNLDEGFSEIETVY